MPRTCTICTHTDKEAINQELVSGASLRNIAKRFDTSAPALFRLKQDHMPASLALAKEAEDVAQADGLLGQLVDLQDKAMSILGKAEEAGDMRTALMALKEARATMELVGKVTGELVHKQEINVNNQWRFTIGKGYELDESEAPDHSARVVNGTVLGELPPAAGAE